ncbi:MAG: GWxTD domain-containing protein [Candidatus Zixiibacteriota bacterium]|nr:MAG: GWxTD domain-containing protein [candidate division Zixibacteria bacterium]
MGKANNAPTSIIVLLGILCFGSLADAGDRLTIQAGISVFNNPADGPRTYVEFPFSLDRNQFTFVATDSIGLRVRASIFAEIVISDTLGFPVDSANTYFYTGAESMERADDDNIKIFNKLKMMLKPGIYSATLTVIDVVSKSEGSFLYNRLEITPPVSDRLALSTLELAYNIRIVPDFDRANLPHLVKNGREVIPNPMAIYSVDDTAMFVYAELYNLSYRDGGEQDRFSVAYRARRLDGSLDYSFGETVKQMPDSSAVICNELSIAGWQPGRYELDLVATDLKSGTAVTGTARFVIFPGAGPLPGLVTYTMKGPLDTAGLQTRRQLIRFLVDPEELVLFNALTDSGQARYIDQFFDDRDPTPGTAENEFLNDAVARYIFAIQQFSTLPEIHDGWRTDRGRILMQYGQWDTREEVPAPNYGRQYEVWFYNNLQGGAHFVFLDVGGYGDFKLVHSNASGEVYDPEWEFKLKEQHYDIIQKKDPFIK